MSKHRKNIHVKMKKRIYKDYYTVPNMKCGGKAFLSSLAAVP